MAVFSELSAGWKHIERPYHAIWSGFSSILQPSCFGNIILDEVE